MTALPAAAAFTGSAETEGGFKTAITNQREFLAGLLGTLGTQAQALATLGALMKGVVDRSTVYTVIAGDRGTLFNCTLTWTLSLTAAATLGDGFAFAIRNSGTGVITVDPNGGEQIDGASTVTLAAGESCVCVCDGTAWRTVSKAAALTAAAIATALGYTPASRDVGVSGIGMICNCYVVTSNVASGATCDGSNLIIQSGYPGTGQGAAPTGSTWRNICPYTAVATVDRATFERIA